MDEIKYVSLEKFQIEPTLDDKFWEEKVKRSIQDCDSVSTLKEMATLLVRIATQRQGVIRGLVQDMFIFQNVSINQDEIANPQIESEK
jgi:stage III sporulation protein SpoIIIAA